MNKDMPYPEPVIAGLDKGSSNVPGEIYLANDSRFVDAYFSEPLTIYATGWKDDAEIEKTLKFLAPEVPTSRRFEYAAHDNKDDFLSDTDDVRASGSDFKRVEYHGTKVTAKTENHGLTSRVDLDDVKEKPNWRNLLTAKLMRRIKRNSLRRAINLALAAATNTAKTWNSSADPDAEITSELITAGDISGINPNRVLFGANAWQLRFAAYRGQNNAGADSSAKLTEAQLSDLLQAEVLCDKTRRQDTASAKVQLMGSSVLMFLGMDSPDEMDPSNVKRFISGVEGGGYYRVYEQQVSAKLVDITVEHYEKTVLTSALGLRKFTVS